MSRLSDARDELYTALSHVFEQPVPIPGGAPVVYSPGRVHRYPPSQPVTPCVWIEQPSADLEAAGVGSLLGRALFPVVVCVDGADPAQVGALDELVSRVWDASTTARLCNPNGFEPGPVDVGGPSLRATRVEVGVTIAARTLCSPTPVPAEMEVA